MMVGSSADEEQILSLVYVAVSGVAEQFTVSSEASSKERLGYDAGGDAVLRWRQLRGGVLHRAAHARYGTGRISPLDATAFWPDDLRVPWVESCVCDLGRQWEEDVGRILDVPGRDHFLLLLESLEDLRIEARLTADLPGCGDEIDQLRQIEAARSGPESPAHPRAFMRDQIHRLSLGCSVESSSQEWPALLGQVATIVTGVCSATSPFEDVLIGSLFLHRITLELPYLSAANSPLGVEIAADASRTALFSWLRDLAATPRIRSTGGEGEARWDGSIRRPTYRDQHFGRYYGYAGAGRVREAVYLLDPDSTTVRSSRYGPTMRKVDLPDGSVDPAELERRRAAESPWLVEESQGAGEEAERVETVNPSPPQVGVANSVAIDEWDSFARRYLRGWCTVSVSSPDLGEARPIRERYSSGRPLKMLEQAVSRWPREGLSWLSGVADGPEIEIDRYVSYSVESRVPGLSPDPRFYAKSVRSAPDVLAMCLIDASVSTARRTDEVGTDGKRVSASFLELAVDASAAFATVLSRADHLCEVYSVRSYGRSDVRLEYLARGNASTPGHQFPKIRPAGRSRVAAGIRTLGIFAARSDQATKVLLVVTDGLPFDTDYGDHVESAAPVTYAVEDTIQAMSDVEAMGVRVRLLVVSGGSLTDSRLDEDPRVATAASAVDVVGCLADLYADIGG
ncbi:hypothetical protein [Actinophytocola sp.]|uniref:hypothetical protein n=1 Tax=Actinophytocola sp. TaxID=1872138 RepID=UPI003D6A0A38